MATLKLEKQSTRFLNKYILLSKVVFQQNKSFYLFARTLEPNNEWNRELVEIT